MNIEIPPRPKLFQWYHHIIPNKFENWNIWIVKRGPILWGFSVYPDGKSDINYTNLRYWNEKDFPWHESLDKGEKTVKTDTPHLDEGTKLLILQAIFQEDHGENSQWFFG